MVAYLLARASATSAMNSAAAETLEAVDHAESLVTEVLLEVLFVSP